MKINPVIIKHIHTCHTSFIIDFGLSYNITFITGDSGTGKSTVYSFLEELGTEDPRIRCFNYLDYKRGYKTSIRRSKGKLFVIDNADILLDDKTREYIACDALNQYIIIGNNPTGLLLTHDNIYELDSKKEEGKTIFRLKNAFGI